MPSLFRSIISISLLVFILVISNTSFAGNLTVALSKGDEVPITQFQADGDTLILWTPSGFGMLPPARTLAQALTFDGIETWLADLHDAFFLARGHNSVNQFPPDQLVELFDKALKLSGKKKLLLMTTGSGSKPILKAARRWQLKHPGNSALAGLILFHPSLYAGRPALGKKAKYLPVVNQTNLPIFIIQPTLSTTRFRVAELQKELKQGGSQVYIKIITGARDGYHIRPDDDLEEIDQRAKTELPTLISRATKILLSNPAPKQAAAKVRAMEKSADAILGLRRYKTLVTPPLKLSDMNDKIRQLSDYKGKVVLVSFWASWCPPCIKEMPSMNRLNKKLKGKPFAILGVNIGEKKPEIRSFLKRTNVSFTILRDEKQKAYNDWKVYVVPSNFIIDGNGVVRMGSVGAVEWDSPEVVKEIETLMLEAGTK